MLWDRQPGPGFPMTGLPLAGSGEEASQASSFCFGRTLAMPLTSSKTILHLKNCLEAGRAAQLMVLVSKLALRDTRRIYRAFVQMSRAWYRGLGRIWGFSNQGLESKTELVRTRAGKDQGRNTEERKVEPVCPGRS